METPAPEMRPLWEHQKKAIAMARDRTNLALFMPCGVGKTRTMIEILREDYNTEKRIRKTLILAPLAVCAQWRREFERYSKVPQEKIFILNKAGFTRVKQFQKAVNAHEKGCIIVTNYEAVPTKGLHPLLLAWQPEIVIYDEIHRCKDFRSVRFKSLKPLAQGARRRFGLSGSPVLNSPMDLFGQYSLLDNGATFGENFWAFRLRYLYDKNAMMPRHIYFPAWVPRPGSSEELAAKLAETAVQANKHECLDLPPELDVVLPVGMGPEQRKAYTEMKRFYITQVKEEKIVANLAITQTLRMRQILCGFVQGPTGEVMAFHENPRLDALVEKVKDLVLSQKVVIWTDFVPTYQMIAKALAAEKIESVQLTGQQSAAQKGENEEAFRFGSIPVAICNPQAVGLGVEFTEAASSLYYSQSYSFEHHEQTRSRNYRGGSEMHEKITRYYLMSEGETDKEVMLDSIIHDCVKNKADLAKTLLTWAREAVQ